ERTFPRKNCLIRIGGAEPVRLLHQLMDVDAYGCGIRTDIRMLRDHPPRRLVRGFAEVAGFRARGDECSACFLEAPCPSEKTKSPRFFTWALDRSGASGGIRTHAPPSEGNAVQESWLAASPVKCL